MLPIEDVPVQSKPVAAAEAPVSTDRPLDLLWVEKYRPRTIEDMALSTENRLTLEQYIRTGDFPHLLLTGPPGVGKTTLARILTTVIPCEVLTLNASNERGIDTIRDKVGLFARGLFGAKRNVVFLDEADGLTPEAQDTLRNLMEANAQTRFILTGNRLHKITSAIQSRCTHIELAEMPIGERARVLKKILSEEGYDSSLEAVFAYAKEYPDLRRMLNAAQKSIQTHSELKPPEPVPDGRMIVDTIKKKQWKAIVDLAKTPGFDHAEQLRGIFWAIDPDERGAAPRLIAVAKAVHEVTWTRDPVILFLGCCAELMESYG